MVSVSDTGSGIAKEHLDKVFEPFFTTKEVGMASGLGLSMVYGFVKQSRGHVRLHSEIGSGSSVKIYLPQRSTQPRRAVAGPDGDSMHDQGAVRASNGETVLLVEDNEQVRRLGVSALQNLAIACSRLRTTRRVAPARQPRRVACRFVIHGRRLARRNERPRTCRGVDRAAAEAARPVHERIYRQCNGPRWAPRSRCAHFEKALHARTSRARDPPVDRRSTRRRSRHACLNQTELN